MSIDPATFWQSYLAAGAVTMAIRLWQIASCQPDLDLVRKDAEQMSPTMFGAEVIATIALFVCVWPVVWPRLVQAFRE